MKPGNLVLSRSVGQSVWIYFGGKKVRVTYVGKNKCREARIAFQADKDVSIFRDELYVNEACGAGYDSWKLDNGK